MKVAFLNFNNSYNELAPKMTKRSNRLDIRLVYPGQQGRGIRRSLGELLHGKICCWR